MINAIIKKRGSFIYVIFPSEDEAEKHAKRYVSAGFRSVCYGNYYNAFEKEC